MIKVLHITENPIAGAPMNLNLALNKYQGDKVTSRHLAASDRNENRVFKSDMLTGVNTYDEIRNTILWADILHFHNFYSNQDLFRRYPDLWPLALTKPRVWQAHSPRSTTWVDLEEALRDSHARHLVIGQYHPRQWPECEVVPNVIDIFEPLLSPRERNWSGPLRVAFSPSRIRLTGWDNKGYDETFPVLQRLVNRRLITAEIIYDKPHNECLAMRQKANIAIDEVVTGSYHLCSLEALSQGCATFAGLDEIQIKTLKDLTGADWLPWIVADPNSLLKKLYICTLDPNGTELWAKRSRDWMETYWHPKDMTNRFVEIYKGT